MELRFKLRAWGLLGKHCTSGAIGQAQQDDFKKLLFFVKVLPYDISQSVNQLKYYVLFYICYQDKMFGICQK
jgi:hypothetical protein